jgi:glycosyltransferase involved in cell wall biosynthesis
MFALGGVMLNGSVEAPVGSPEIRVVIPAFCEELRIADCVTEYCRYFGARAEVVVVANGCRDRTAEIVRELMREFTNLSLIEIKHAIGKGGAVRVGLKSGSEPFVGYTDADGSTTAAEFDSLMQVCRTVGCDGAIGSRWIRGANVTRKQPLLRRFTSRTFNLIVRSLFGLPFSDTQCGAKLFRRDAVDRVLGELELANFAFDIDLLYALKRFGFNVVECPISWEDSPNDSKIKLISSSYSMLLSILRLRLRHGALRMLPYGDLIARSAVIPVKKSLTLIVACDRPRNHTHADAEERELARWASAWEADGHRVHWLATPSWRDVPRIVSWYLRRGHREVDAIVAFRSRLYPLTHFSSKPKLSLEFDGTGRDAVHLRRSGLGPTPATDDDARRAIRRLETLGRHSHRFFAAAGSWNIALQAEGAHEETTLAI